MLLEVLPGHSDGVTFNVLARPGVNHSGEKSAATLRRVEAGIFLRVVTLPCVAHRVCGTGLRVLPNLVFRQVRQKIDVPLSPLPVISMFSSALWVTTALSLVSV